MKRWHQEIHITRRNWRNHRRIHVEGNLDYSANRIGRDPYEVDCECDNQMGRFRKKDAYDCGNTKCYICSGDKYPKRTKHEQELISELGFAEQLKELLEDDES